jgi:CRP-like cAMP-binding protein
MEECLFSPGETIFSQNDKDDSSIYYIDKGTIIILVENTIKGSERD